MENRYNYIIEVWDEKNGKMKQTCTKQVDHLDTNTLNNNAANLQYITPTENIRRKTLASRLKNKHGIDLKRLTPTLCKGIYSLPEERIGEFIGRFLMACKGCEDPMEIWSIRTCVAIALDIMRVSNAVVDGSGQLLTTNNPS